MQVLVTGASGFIGSALCNALLESEHDVIAVIREGGKSPAITCENGGVFRVLECDLGNYAYLPEQVECSIDCFYHFAWEGVSGPKISDPLVQTSNILYSCNAVKAASSLGAKRFVFAASLITLETNYAIEHGRVLSPNCIYGSAKQAAAQMNRCLCEQEGIDYCEAIISNVYGAGEVSLRLVNSSIRKLIAGDHCSFTDGSQDYDFIYIEDAARGLIAIGEKGKPGKSYYLGNGEILPLKQYLSMMGNVVDPDAVLGFGEIPAKGFSLDYSQFELDELENDTGFKPEISFEDGIGRTRDWIVENG